MTQCSHRNIALSKASLSFCRGVPAAPGFGRYRVRCPDAFEQYAGGFVAGVLRYQFAAEGFGENCGRQFVNPGAGGMVARFDAIGVSEQLLDAADDFGLFFKCG